MELSKTEHEGMIFLIQNEIESDTDIIEDLEVELQIELMIDNRNEEISEKRQELSFWRGEIVMLKSLLERLKK